METLSEKLQSERVPSAITQRARRELGQQMSGLRSDLAVRISERFHNVCVRKQKFIYFQMKFNSAITYVGACNVTS